LNKGGKEKLIGKSYINPWADEPEIGYVPWCWQVDVIITRAKCNIHKRLKPVTKICRALVLKFTYWWNM
jgi:hypothetical protein